MTTQEVVLTTCPRDCYDGCGIAVIKREGRVHRVIGDRTHPVSRGALCGKCALAYNGVWRDQKARLSTPLRRSGPKGSGRFEPIDWEEALRVVSEQLKSAIVSDGAKSILHTHYTGTCSTIAGEFPMRFFNRLGATEVSPDTICNNAGHVALDYVLGSSVTGFDPNTAEAARCIVVWGANPSASAPHIHKHWLGESAATVVVVDPVRHETAAAADIHLQPFPGTDAVLAFALMKVMLRDDLVDRAFIEAHTVGWSELEPQVSGCELSWAEAITGVPVAQIEQVAHLYASGPSLLWLGQGLQRQPRGGNVMRACAMLPAITGNIGKAGAGIYYLNGSGPRNIDGDYVSGSQLGDGQAPSISHMELVDVLDNPARSRVLISWNMNVAASGPRQARLHECLQREDLFTVVIDLFQTDTAEFADIILPAASFLEFDDLMLPYFHFLVSAQVKAEEAPGDALPNQDIFRRLAAAMGYTEPELFESDVSIINYLLENSGLGINFETLKRQGWHNPLDKPHIAFEEHDYPTPSGHIEIASERAEKDGHSRTPTLSFDARPPKGEFRLLSPASQWQMNDSYGNDAIVRRTLGECEVKVCPTDASSLGIADGDAVELFNQTGQLRCVTVVSDEVPPGIALSYKGRWPKLEGALNVNGLNPGKATDMGESSSVHGVQVQIRRLLTPD